MTNRRTSLQRETKETQVSVEIYLEGTGQAKLETSLPMLDHLLSHVAHHGLLDISIKAQAKGLADQHHLVEDIAITLGRALSQALGERRGIVRMAHALVPMDEALALVALDIGGRGYAVLEMPFATEKMEGLATDLLGHFLESLALESRINLHVQILRGTNDHHKAEALFKALGRALGEATRLDPRREGQVPSTKGIIER